MEHHSNFPIADSVERPRRGRRRWVRWTASVGALVLIIEGGLRLVLGLGRPVLYQADPDCGYLAVPSQSTYRFFCWNRINAQSMRSPTIIEPKPPGEFRLMLLGDSVTFGTTHVDQSKIFASLLRQDLPAEMGRPVEVLNASAGAWASFNEWGYLRSRGTFQSDEVAFVLNTGDLDQPFNPGALGSATGYPDHDPPLAIGELIGRYVLPRIFHQAAPVDAGSTAGSAADPEITSRVLAILSEASTFVRQRHAGLAIFYCPCTGPMWSTDAYHVALDRLKGWAARNQVPLLDMSPYLAAYPPADMYQDGVHLRPAGNKVVAAAIEDHWRELAPSALRQ